MSDRRNDPVNDEVERVSRELCEALDLDAEEIVDGEPRWRSSEMVEMAFSAISSHRLLTR